MDGVEQQLKTSAYDDMLSCRNLADLMEAIKGAISVRRELVGLLTEEQKLKREHLELEREKVQMQKQAQQKDGTGDIERWVVEGIDDVN